MYCGNCGKKIEKGIKICPNCGEKPVEENKSTKKEIKEEKIEVTSNSGTSIGWAILGFFFPLVGLILFLMWMKNKKNASKAAGIGALIGFVTSIIFTVLSFVWFIRLIQVYDDGYRREIPSIIDEIIEDRKDDDKPEDKKPLEGESLDINDINTKYNLKARGYAPKLMEEFGNQEKDYIDNGLLVKRNYNQLTVKNDYTGEIIFNFDDVKNVYYKYHDCSGLEAMVVVTKEKAYYINYYVHEQNNLDYKIITGDYTEFYEAPNHSYTCGGSSIILGKGKDGAYYDLNGEVEVSLKDLYYYDSPNNYINTIRGYKLGGSYGSVKLVIKSSETDIVLGIVDVYNKAFTYGYDNGGVEETSKLELINNSFVKEVEYSPEDDIVILTFENDEQYSFEYAKIEY